MNKRALSSKERMLMTIKHEETDYTPCCFMLFFTLQSRCGGDWRKFADAQIALGLDTAVNLPGVPVNIHPDVAITEWKTPPLPGSSNIYPVLHKKYETPAGDIIAEVKQTEDWEGGDHIGLVSDYNVPRSIKYHVGGRADLKGFRYLLAPPTADQIRVFREACAERRTFAQDRGLLLQTGIEAGSVMDMAIQIAGVEPLVFAAIEDPDYLEEFLSVIWNMNMLKMEIMLDEKPDLFVRRGWYENMSFWSPDMYRRFMKPHLAKETRWAHGAGVKFAYINTCMYTQILEDIIEAGVDVLIGVDPVEDKKLDMRALKARSAGRLCLWGGGNGFVTVENGSPEQIREEVNAALDILAPGGGFILSPIDNVRELSDRAYGNAVLFIDAWKARRAPGLNPA